MKLLPFVVGAKLAVAFKVEAVLAVVMIVEIVVEVIEMICSGNGIVVEKV